MPTKPFEPEILVEGFEAFADGMDSGVQPVLLPPTQLAFAENLTIRGDYISPRAINRQIILNFGSNPGADILINGVWQGAAYLKPDAGTEQLAFVASGRLFIVTPDPNGLPSATVIERTIAGDPNPATQPQAWLWQSEMFLNWTDGLSGTIFYNSSATITAAGIPPQTAARSNFGLPVNFTTTVGVGATIQAIGASQTWELASNANILVGDIITFKNNGQMVVTAVGSPNAGTSVTMVNQSAIPVGVFAAVGKVLSWSHIGTQLPPGRMGTYWHGRNIMALTDGKQFVIGDATGGASGTAAAQFRDSVISITENTYLAGGGNFAVPGSIGDIRAIIGTATLDASLGQGPALIVTPFVTFSLNLPTDRLTWQNLTNPILTESMVSNGGLGQYSTVNFNSDTIMRSVDGIRSLKLARQDFELWSNTPISYEVMRILENDNRFLLKYSSSMVFDNRLLMTAGPQATSRGVVHQGEVVLNADPVTSLRGKQPSVYDGLWTGLQVLQFVKGIFNEVERGFAFVFNSLTQQIELWEVMPTVPSSPNFDLIGPNQSPVSVTYEFETAVRFKEHGGQKMRPKRLRNGEIFLDFLDGRADVQVYWRPDSEQCWTLWKTFSVCNTPNSPNSNGYRPRIGFGEPPGKCDPINNKPYREGFYFQFKFIITGAVSVKSITFQAETIPSYTFAKPGGCCPGENPAIT